MSNIEEFYVFLIGIERNTKKEQCRPKYRNRAKAAPEKIEGWEIILLLVSGKMLFLKSLLHFPGQQCYPIMDLRDSTSAP
jgi:hypothetical protein